MPNKTKKKSSTQTLPAQKQPHQPGRRGPMRPRPETQPGPHTGSGKLEGRIAIITGGDSGIGRAVAIAFAREGASVAIVYLEETQDAEDTRDHVQAEGGEALLIKGDIGREALCRRAVERTVNRFGQLDVLINNAGEQHPTERIEDIDEKQLVRTFRTNIFSMFHMTRAAVPHLRRAQGAVVNSTSVTAYRGSPHLLDYSATKGAIVSFTRSLSGALAKDGVRVNAVAPGPIWTPLIPASFPKEKVRTFGSDVPLGRPGQPDEVAPSYVFLASDDASYITGQVLHPNGGEIING